MFTNRCYPLTICALVLFLTRTSAIVLDMAILVLTWAKTYRHWRQLQQLDINISATGVLVRDGNGTSCFIIPWHSLFHGKLLQGRSISCEVFSIKAENARST